MARTANLIVEIVYWWSFWSKEQVVIMDVFVSVDNESFKILVNFEFRYGIWSDPFVKECITFPRQERDKLIFFVYSRVWPLTPLFLTFYEPARSIKHNLVLKSAPLHWKFRYKNKIVWLLEETSLVIVAAIFLLLCPCCINLSI